MVFATYFGTEWHRSMAKKLRKVIHHGQERWIVDLRAQGAGRKFFETEDAAKAHLDAKLIEIRNHGVSALSLSHEDRIQFL